MKRELEQGRAVSGLVSAKFYAKSGALAAYSLSSPEATSRVAAGLAAWGAKKQGDALAQAVLDETRERVRSILAKGLRESGLSDLQLGQMSAAQLAAVLPEMRYGNQVLRELLSDEPEIMPMLQAQATDLAAEIGVLALSKTEVNARSIDSVKAELSRTRRSLEQYKAATAARFDRLESELKVVSDATDKAQKLHETLMREVQGNGKAIQALAQISYQGWTTAQKLQAVESGAFPDLLAGKTRQAVVESLRADLRREKAASRAQELSQDLGSLAAIATNVGLPPKLVTALQGAQVAAAGVAQIAGGSYLAGIASLTSLGGLGASDAGSRRHAAVMKYLAGQFSVLNQKLDRIVTLQISTLNALADLAEQQNRFRAEVLGQLDSIEQTVLRSEQILQAVMLSQWTDCNAFVNGTALNGQYEIPNRQVLIEILGHSSTPAYASSCYRRIAGFLDAWVKPATWSGQLIAASNFPSAAIVATPSLQSDWARFASQRVSAHVSARDFMLAAHPRGSAGFAATLARLSQPAVDARSSALLGAEFATSSVAKRFAEFRCNERDVLARPLRDLACFGRVEGSLAAPLDGRWEDLMSAALIGPQALRIIDTGIALARVSDFAVQSVDGVFQFVPVEAIRSFESRGFTEQMRNGLLQRKGLQLLEKLEWLAEANVLQHSLAFGDYTAHLVTETLYDPTTRSLNTEAKAMTPLKASALEAMRVNPTLARNVVMLAMRRSLEESARAQGARDSVSFRQTYYQLALEDFAGHQACAQEPIAAGKLAELFPNWSFGYWVTEEQRHSDARLQSCPEQHLPLPLPAKQVPARGAGVGVVVGEFYVLVPSPLALSEGLFEQPHSLRLALLYRDRLLQERTDRNVMHLVRDIFGDDEVALAASEILDEGWGWPTSSKASRP
jgi:hypothetical protein